MEIDKDSQLASILTDSVPDIRVESAFRYPFLYIVIYLAVIYIAVLAVVVGNKAKNSDSCATGYAKKVTEHGKPDRRFCTEREIRFGANCGTQRHYFLVQQRRW